MLKKIVECGRTNPINDSIERYGETHHWQKYNIFIELPCLTKHLIWHIHNVIHTGNFFNNLINTLLNGPCKTKNSINLQKDLKNSLYLTSNGKAPIPISIMVLDV